MIIVYFASRLGRRGSSPRRAILPGFPADKSGRKGENYDRERNERKKRGAKVEKQNIIMYNMDTKTHNTKYIKRT
jgi:hypothetical protein